MIIKAVGSYPIVAKENNETIGSMTCLEHNYDEHDHVHTRGGNDIQDDEPDEMYNDDEDGRRTSDEQYAFVGTDEYEGFVETFVLPSPPHQPPCLLHRRTPTIEFMPYLWKALEFKEDDILEELSQYPSSPTDIKNINILTFFVFYLQSCSIHL